VTRDLALPFAHPDCDDGLIGERRDQPDFMLGERFDAVTRQDDDANRLAFAHQRHADHRSRAANLRLLLERVSRVGEKVVDAHHLPAHGGSADHGSRARRERPLPLHICRVEVAADLETVDALVYAKDLPACRAAKPHRGVDNGLQDRAQLELGSADSTEEIRRRGQLLQQLIPFAHERGNGPVLPRGRRTASARPRSRR